MVKLLGAIDDSTYNGQEYLSVIVGDSDSIKSNLKVLPSGFTHLTDVLYTFEIKKQIVRRLNFQGNILGYCLRFDSHRLDFPINSAIQTGKCRMSSKSISRKIAYEFAFDIQKMYADFAYSNHTSVKEINFEVDNRKILGYLVDGGLGHCTRGDILNLADCVAFANSHGWEVRGNIRERQDFKDEFSKRVMKSLTRGK